MVIISLLKAVRWFKSSPKLDNVPSAIFPDYFQLRSHVSIGKKPCFMQGVY